MELSFRVPTLPQVADFAAWKGEADCNERNSPAARNLLKKTILNSSRSIDQSRRDLYEIKDSKVQYGSTRIRLEC
jgi:hypothetical protein